MALAGQEALFSDWIGIDRSLKKDVVVLFLFYIFRCSGSKVHTKQIDFLFGIEGGN